MINPIFGAYCRIYQTVFKLALPLLPYRSPEILEHVGEIPDVMKREGIKKPLVVTDKSVRGLGLTKTLEESLARAGFEFEIFDGVVANPTTKNAEEAKALYVSSGCDCLIAFGGGSPMDCAKCVGALVAKPKKKPGQLKGILRVRKRIPTLFAVPTTAGTGSETTLACVIVDSETRHKYAINDFPLIPRYAVLDPEVTATLPPFVTATTGLDALTHAVESYIGKSGNRSTRKDAVDAVRLVFSSLGRAVEDGKHDMEARRDMLRAAHLAGRSFTKAYVGYVHAMAHALGGKYDIPHGLANAVILPYVLREYGRAAEKKLAELAAASGVVTGGLSDAEAAERFILAIEDMNKRFGIPEKIDAVRREDIPEMAGYAYREALPLYPVPVMWDREQLERMFCVIGGLEK